MTKQTINNQNIWSKFTGRYPLSKTIRFELKPVGRTEEFLKRDKILEKDKIIDESYRRAKFYFDKLHQRFINEAFSVDAVKNLDLHSFVNLFFLLRNKIRKLKREGKQNEIYIEENKINNLRNKYYKKIKLLLDRKAEEWKEMYKNKGILKKTDLKQEGTDLLTKSGILEILKDNFPIQQNEEFKNNSWPSLFIEDSTNKGKGVYIFDSFNNFTTYLIKFQETRKNLYKDDGTSTAVATRVISNFERFLKNKEVFDEKYEDYWEDIGITREEKNIFNISYYFNCFVQEGIDRYNRIIGDINSKSKKYRDKNNIAIPIFGIR